MKGRNTRVLSLGWTLLIRILKVLLLSLSIQPGFAAKSNGTDFWFAFPRGSSLSSTDQAAVSFIITGTPGTTGNISSSTQSPTTSPFQLNTSGYYQWTGVISGTSDPYQTTGNDVIGLRSFHVTAASSVSIQPFFEVRTGANPPIASWQAISTEALGKEYFVLAYGNSSTTSNSEGTEFVVVGTVNGTLVTITPSVAVGSRTAGVAYQITLNQGETYRAATGNANADFTGTLISANQNVAVIAGHTCALIPTSTSICSTVLEQLFPTTGWSRRFILSPLASLPPGTNGDRIRFIANSNGTVVNVNNTSVSLNRGEWYETPLKTFSVNPDPILINSNFPIMVAQYMKDQGDYTVASRFEPSMLMVPGYDHFLTNTTFNLPINGFSNYVNLAAPTSQISSMTLDGIPISPSSFTPVGSTGYSRAILQINPGNASGNHTIVGPLPFGAMIYGQSSVQNAFAGFGSIAGFNMPTIPRASSVTVAPTSGKFLLGTRNCFTATLLTSAGLPVPDASVSFVVTGVNTATEHSSTDASGTVTRCHTGNTVGTDVLVAKASASGVESLPVTIKWIKVSTVDLAIATKAIAYIGSTLCLNATIKDNLGDVVPGVDVTFSVNGVNPSSGTSVSNSSGIANFCYVGRFAGTDNVAANVGNISSSLVSLTWKKVESVTISPPSTSGGLFYGESPRVGAEACFTATVKDNLNELVPDLLVAFSVTGANTGSGSATTDAKGTAAYCYTGKAVGTDTVSAFVSSVSSDITFTWLSPVSSITLTALNQSVKAGTRACVSALAVDDSGKAASEVPLQFSVSGSNSGSGSALTNSSGVADYCYIASTTGVDNIQASSGAVTVKTPVTVTVTANPLCDVFSPANKVSLVGQYMTNCLQTFVRDGSSSAFGQCEASVASATNTAIQNDNIAAGCLLSSGTSSKTELFIAILHALVTPILDGEASAKNDLGASRAIRRYNSIAVQLGRLTAACTNANGSLDIADANRTFDSLFSLSGRKVIGISAGDYSKELKTTCSLIASY